MPSQKQQRTGDTEPEQTVGKPCQSTCSATSPRQSKTAEDSQPRDRARDRREGDEKELRATLQSLVGPIAAEAVTIEVLKDR